MTEACKIGVEIPDKLQAPRGTLYLLSRGSAQWNLKQLWHTPLKEEPFSS
jgi:hypothetical protein